MATERSAGASGALIVSAVALRAFVGDILMRAGLAEAHAAIVADVLVWANLRGTDSHGVSRVPRYLEMIAAGELNPRPDIRPLTETAATILLDADRAAGPVAMTAAMEAAARKAAEAGIGLALVRSTTHTAALGYYAVRAAHQGYAAIATAASVPNMAYHGARAAGVSTSPLCIAVPGGAQGPLVLDMGSGLVSLGRLGQARRLGQPIPEGWALDRDGKPTTDPQQAEIPLPFAGPKGSGLALMVECLTSLIVANPILADSVGQPARARRHRQNALAIALDVARFGDPAMFRREVDRLVAALKALPRATDAEILMPGERGARAYEQRNREGIPLPRAIYDELTKIADRFGLPVLEARPAAPAPDLA